MTALRETTRDALTVLLSAGVTSAQTVYNYQINDLGGQSPVVICYSAGSNREPLTGQGNQTHVYLNVDSYVLYRDPESSYGEDDAEDMLDAIEQEIAAVIESNRTNGTIWGYLGYDDASTVLKVDLGGTFYLWESIPLLARVYA